MAMNKKEKEHLERLESELQEARAFRYSPAIPPDIPVPDVRSSGVPMTKGWLFHCYISDGSARVEPACSSYSYHAFGRDDKTTTQGGRALFSTRLLALQAMRGRMVDECAKMLARVDRQIEKEIASGNPTTAETASSNDQQ